MVRGPRQRAASAPAFGSTTWFDVASISDMRGGSPWFVVAGGTPEFHQPGANRIGPAAVSAETCTPKTIVLSSGCTAPGLARCGLHTSATRVRVQRDVCLLPTGVGTVGDAAPRRWLVRKT